MRQEIKWTETDTHTRWCCWQRCESGWKNTLLLLLLPFGWTLAVKRTESERVREGVKQFSNWIKKSIGVKAVLVTFFHFVQHIFNAFSSRCKWNKKKRVCELMSLMRRICYVCEWFFFLLLLAFLLLSFRWVLIFFAVAFALSRCKESAQVAHHETVKLSWARERESERKQRPAHIHMAERPN